MTGVRATRLYTYLVEDGYNLFCIKFRMKSEPRVAARALYSNLHAFLDEDLSPYARIATAHLRTLAHKMQRASQSTFRSYRQAMTR